MSNSLRKHRGFAMFAIALVLMTLAIIIIAMRTGSTITAIGQRFSGTQYAMTRIQQGLVQYVAAHGELPCPSNPTLAATNALAGYPNSNATIPSPASTCSYPGGVIPWKALGLTVNDVTDPWGRLISYRVFDGAIGLTQDQGASKVNCDTSNIDLAGRKTPETSPVSGLCATDYNTLDTSFVHHSLFPTTTHDKGLVVNDFGTVVPNVAYVLISHGPSGLGGWLPTGSHMALPGSTASDYPNISQTPALTPTYYPSQTPTSFVKMAASDPSVVAGAAGHYDDVVAYLKITDLAQLAKLDARNWPEGLRTATDIQDFNITTTSNLTNTVTTDHFLTTTVDAAHNTTQEFQQALGGGGVLFGGASGTFSSCLWWPNQIDLYSPPTATAAAGTSWASGGGGVITFKTSANHTLATGDVVTVTGTSLSGYNNTYTVTGTPTSTTFTVAKSINPGAWVSGGTINRISTLTARTLTLKAGTSWSADTITFATLASHNLAIGDVITVTGASPSGYNGIYAVTGTPTSNTFTVAQSTNPGAWTSGGTFVTGRLWSAGVITFYTLANHNYSVGSVVVVSGASRDGYNGTYTVTGTPSSTTFTVAEAVDPGLWVSGGTVSQGMKRTLIVSVEAAFNSLTGSSDAGGGLVVGFLPTDGYWVNGAAPGAISLAPTLTITSASWTFFSGPITFTTSGTFPFVTGNTVVVSGMSNSGYNGTYTVTGTPTSTSFTVSHSSYPGAFSSSGGTVTGTICGSSSGTSRIGWDNSGDGNLPSPRFGVEMDMQYNSSRNDPSSGNEVSVVSTGVSHGSNAATCVNSANTYHTNTLVTVTNGTSWSGGVSTFTTSTNHNLATGDMVTVTGVSPGGYNGIYAVTGTPTSTTFTVVNPVNPGAWASGGTVGINDCYTGSSNTWLMDGLTHFQKVRAEIEPKSSSCGSTAPLLKYWLLPYGVCSSLNTLVTGTSWSGGFITFHTSANHSLATGGVVTVTGASPSGYNGTYTVTATPTSTTFTVVNPVNPGAWVSGGAIPTIATLVTGTSWSGGFITFKTAANHGFVTANAVTVMGASTAAYNGTFTITSTPTTTTFTAAYAVNPGSWSFGGTVTTAQDCTDIENVSVFYTPQSFPNGGVYLSSCIAVPNPTDAFDSVYFGFTSNNTSSTNSSSNLILQKLNSSLISIP